MNQLSTYTQVNDDGPTSRRCSGFPLNSTLVSYFTPDTIRSIITNAANGKPYTTAVWIRLNRVGIQISAQDPQIARTRIPVFIPLSLVHDIFLHPTITNIICIVYDEVKSNMKGVLLYVVHPNDAHLMREDFRLFKQSFYSKGVSNPNLKDEASPIMSPTLQKTPEPHRHPKLNPHASPRRILYIRDNEIGANREIPALTQGNYTKAKSSYHSSRDDSIHRRHRSPKKIRNDHSISKPASEDGRQSAAKSVSISPKTFERSESKAQQISSDSVDESTKAETQKEYEQQQQQVAAAWQTAQIVPIVPMGIYNRYLPKAIPLQTGETIKTTLPSPATNGHVIAHIEPQPTGKIDENSHRSPSRSRSISSKRQDCQQRNRSSSAQNAAASAKIHQMSHHHHHHHRHHHASSNNATSATSSIRADSQKYGTISHSVRKRTTHLPMVNPETKPPIDQSDEMKKYLKQLVDDMQTIKIEMNKMRQSTSAARTRPDSLRINLKEIRHDLDAIRARMAMTPKVIHA